MAEEKRDIVPAIAIGGGAVAIAAGVYFFTRKPAGFDPGDTIVATFKFDYLGDPDTYILQVSFGTILIGNIFDHIEGLIWETQVDLVGPDTYELIVLCDLPVATKPKVYDAEALIRTPAMDRFDYIIKLLADNAINVRSA